MRSVQLQKSYKSPRHKLLQFFEQSRDQWKAKCRQAKADLKRLNNRLRRVESRKDELQAQLTVLRQENRRLSQRNHVLTGELTTLKKSEPSSLPTA
jgi:predicted nuclease with TOPRIM domain